jgi:hypothetical protein
MPTAGISGADIASTAAPNKRLSTIMSTDHPRDFRPGAGISARLTDNAILYPGPRSTKQKITAW